MYIKSTYDGLHVITGTTEGVSANVLLLTFADFHLTVCLLLVSELHLMTLLLCFAISRWLTAARKSMLEMKSFRSIIRQWYGHDFFLSCLIIMLIFLFVLSEFSWAFANACLVPTCFAHKEIPASEIMNGCSTELVKFSISMSHRGTAVVVWDTGCSVSCSSF